MLLFLSRYETFGIAAAEAMVIGIPVITSKCTAMPEIVGEAGVYIDADHLAEAYDDFLGEHNFERNIRIGKKIANEYKWSACVERLMHVLS
jgi:glycosyltransferase involved in cell wall biosynthesis